ncbi:heme oxygenase [Sphingomonas sp. BE138]|uniref:biliverdin-producing heme oxygenase n=1 Tax=Sphingomonas sp. BE138 TaxID=2817845 RepID=UPI00285504FE|nr:biliverdin-producing heme oxygenase [Sphingomonas sp. BE138]MDR6786842.1 heme oxygenase [Sphingomonas sp. BE138]
MTMLRDATGAAHEQVDAAFGAHHLAAPAAYRAFLLAHARALPVAEAAMAALPFAATLPPRTPLLAADLADLGAALPAPLPFAPGEDAASRWGVLYVVEGSRLGGALLARQVPAGTPCRYLGAVHAPGQWRAVRAALDEAAAGQDADWTGRMIAGALATFALYAAAARDD